MARAEASRTHTIRDIIIYPKTRKLVLIWLSFNAVIITLAVRAAEGIVLPLVGIVCGMIIYSVVEYLSHRFLYHDVPKSRILRLLTADVARAHLRHHEEPAKYGGAINGNQLPVVGFATVLALLALVAPLPLAATLFALASGTLSYMAQELVHFGCHQLPMRGRFASAMKRHHMLHHYRDDTANFGILWSVWDVWLGTHVERKLAGKS
ncbi:sterol desaturase family protein [Acuticoccus sp. MNP-M23]|uniref:sterol desaturase family protein n=1 Tax=Acuticoccus sp. MNP-M23 TaxID=3072793 RepID=UPI002815E5ED|nr:sterol desaturase family protein [Acuticoccus sp. MNP-M23]WMS41532.1 sterol desaturase family protein [Acuticoccus sp. MNP-M23]